MYFIFKKERNLKILCLMFCWIQYSIILTQSDLALFERTWTLKLTCLTALTAHYLHTSKQTCRHIGLYCYIKPICNVFFIGECPWPHSRMCQTHKLRNLLHLIYIYIYIYKIKVSNFWNVLIFFCNLLLLTTNLKY